MTPASLSTSSSKGSPDSGAVSSQARHWKFPVAALAALVLVAGFEAVVWKNRYRLWDAHHILGDVKRKALTSSRPPDTMAIFGVSRFYHIDPDEIASVLGPGARVTNYSWRWCGMEAYEAMLRGLIQAGRVPKYILVDGIPEILGYRPDLVSARENESFQTGLIQTAPALALLRTGAGHRDLGWMWDTASHYMTPPSTLYREPVTAALELLVKERRLPPLPENYETVVEAWQDEGYLVFAPGKAGSDQEYRELEKLTGPYRLYENRSALHAYERFVQLAQEHDIRVILLPVPNNPLIFAAYEREGVFAAYGSWLDKLEKKYPNFTAPQPRWLNWPESMGDAGHVHEDGARKHMELIVQMLRDLNLQ